MNLLYLIKVLKNSGSAVLKTTIPGLPPRSNNKPNHYINNINIYEESIIKTSRTETNNKCRTDTEVFKVWKGKGAKSKTIPRQSLNLSNKFDMLGEKEESSESQINYSEFEMEKEHDEFNNKKKKKNSKNMKVEKRREKMIKEYDELYALLKFIEEIMVLKTSTHKLKKCKFCKHCKSCCKHRGKCQTGRKAPTLGEASDLIKVELSSNDLELIRKKINHLENYVDAPTFEENNEVKISKFPPDIIPFLLLYICLNFNCIKQNHYKRKALLLRSAKYCARKFYQKHNSRNYFFTYCMKKYDTALTHQTVPTSSQLDQIKNVVSIYDATFYQTEGSQKLVQKSIPSEEEVNPLLIEENDMLHDQDKMNTSDILQVDGTIDLSEDALSEEENISQFIIQNVLNGEYNAIPSNIPQVDGMDDFSEEEVKSVPNHLYAINCEDKKICDWLNFFRGLEWIWESTTDHSMCNLKKMMGDSVIVSFV